MPIRPIDMQVLMPKSQNVSKISQDMANRSENLLQQAKFKNKKTEEKKLKKVIKKEKKEKLLTKNNDSHEDKNKCIYNEEKKSKKNSNSKIDIRI